MIRSTVARVDLAALQSNFRAIREFVGGPSRPAVVGVVKANAYGHGAERVALALEEAGATMLACADIEEAIVLRRAGVRLPILVFGALSVSDLDGLFDYALTPTISTPSAANAVQAAAAKRRVTLGYHLKIDTGMNRLGFRHDNLRRTLPGLLASDNLRLDGVYTHFASADVPESPLFDQQRLNYEASLRVVDDLLCHASGPGFPVGRALSGSPGGPDPSTGSRPSRAEMRDDQVRPATYLRHAANSAATLRGSRVW